MVAQKSREGSRTSKLSEVSRDTFEKMLGNPYSRGQSWPAIRLLAQGRESNVECNYVTGRRERDDVEEKDSIGNSERDTEKKTKPAVRGVSECFPSDGENWVRGT